jgi:Gram-negative bacterial TonB protein C-terminal
MSLNRTLLSVCLIFPSAISHAHNAQQEGLKYISQAVELSDIRAPGSAEFRMTATIRILSKSPVQEGTYSELWSSRERWRRETKIGSFRRIEIGGPKKRWILDDGDNIPPELRSVIASLNMSKRNLSIERIKNKKVGGLSARCIDAETGFSEEEYCVDRQSNTLLLHESFYSNSHDTVVYSDYKKIGDRLFPWSVHYQKEGQQEVEITISGLVLEPSPDISLFVPPPGALELTECTSNDHITAPHAEWAPPPDITYRPGISVVLYLIVASDGSARHILVSRSGGAAFDKQAALTVAGWRFKPGTCGGIPIDTETEVEIRGLNPAREVTRPTLRRPRASH